MPSHPHGPYRFCPYCATALEPSMRAGATRLRCPACGFIHFRNPGVGAAVVVRDEQARILLVKRSANSTQPGKWCIPAGYVDDGEDIRDAAIRELQEETSLIATTGAVLQVATNWHDTDRTTVGVWFEGLAARGEPIPGDDATEVGWFALDQLPKMAFDTDVQLIDSFRESESSAD